MGRRGNMRSRPGLLFIIIFAVCLVIVYFSWRSMSPGIKVKDSYSVQMQSLLDESSKWRNSENREGEDHDRDPDYHLDNVHQRKIGNGPAVHHYDQPEDKDFAIKKDLKQQLADDKDTEKPTVEADKKGFYRQPNGLTVETVKSMERFVHLDLKGAAPRLSYFKEFIPFVKKLGATGLLIEYEDMFPYTGMLSHISAKNAYSLDDIKELLELTKENNLKVMPLIQSFGHMEFILKSDFINLRESSYTPQVIDITQNGSYILISEMVKQILNAHPDATHLHIGCDEVYELGKGASAIEMNSKKLSESQLFLHHVKHIASIVRKHDRRGVIPVIWDDELRKAPVTDIQSSELPSMVEIMVWHYTKYVMDTIARDVWEKYAKLFKSVWIASAFKGATGSRQLFTEPQYHIQNHFSWLDLIAANKQRVNFKGVALTGWQRYDHFATLCELLPVALPSLAVCLATMVNAGFTKEIHMNTSRVLQCNGPIEMTFPEIDKKTNKAIVTQDCRFPGYELYHAVQELYGYTVGMQNNIQHRQDGWMSDYQIAHHFSSPGQLRALTKSLEKQSTGYSMISSPLTKILASIYFEDTVDEWMDENIVEKQRRIEEMHVKIKSLEHYKTWPQRPLIGDVNSKKRNKVNDIDSADNNLQNSRFDKNKNNQLGQNGNAESQDKQYNQHMPYIEPVSESLQKQNQVSENRFQIKLDQKETSLNNKSPNDKTQYNKIKDTSLIGGKQELPQLPKFENWTSKGDQIINEKKSNDVLDNNNEKNNTGGFINNKYRDNSNKDNFKIDKSKDYVEVKPGIYRPTEAKDVPKLPNLDDLKVNPEVYEDDNMRRARYLDNDKKGNQFGQEDTNLKYQKFSDAKISRRGKSDDSKNEGFKSKLDNPKTFDEFSQNLDRDNPWMKKKVDNRFE